MSDSDAVLPPEEKAISKNANDPKQAKRAKVTERQRELDRLGDVKELMSRPWGRRFAWRFMREAFVFDSIATNDGNLAFRCLGRRDMGLMLLKDVQATSPDEYALMVKEAKERD